MTDFDWGVVKVQMKLRRRKENYLLGKVKSIAAKGAFIVGLAGASLFLMGAYDGNQRLVEDTYIVQNGDTLWSIGEEFIKKNTGGERYILEFLEGIKEINPAIQESKGEVYPGQKIRINYWVKE